MSNPNKIKSRSRRETESRGLLGEFSLDKIIPEKYQTIFLFALMGVIFLFFFSPMYFGGQTFESGDIVSSGNFGPYIKGHKDGYTLWNPLIFCGMPAYALTVGYKWFNLIYVLFTTLKTMFAGLFSVGYAAWTFYMFVLAFTSYFLVKHLTGLRLLGLFGAIATCFSSGIMLYLNIGHITKLTAVAFVPLIILMVLKLKEKIRLRDFALLIVALQLFVQGWHVQIIYYVVCAIALYYVFFFIRSLIKKQGTKQLILSMLTFCSAFIIALLIQSDNFTQVYNYNPYSTRGAKSIVETKGISQTDAAGTSNSYDYATNWSFSPQEITTFVVPSFYGFGNSKYSGPLTQDQEVTVNTYFGQMPMVDTAMYMGIIVFFLGLFGLYTKRKEPFVQYLGLLSLIALIISFGKNFPLLYNLMYYCAPYFDKFRVPSMILILVQISFPILAAYGLKSIIELRESGDGASKKLLKFSAIGASLVTLMSLLMQSALSDWFVSRVQEYSSSLGKGQEGLAQQFTALSDYMAGMFTGDLVIGFLLLTAALWIAYACLKKSLSPALMLLAVSVLCLADLWRIDSRSQKYSDNAYLESQLKEPAYVKMLKGLNNKEPYRILNLKEDNSLGSYAQNSNYNARFLLQDFSGYSAIKPRAYQDIIDVCRPDNPAIWRMLNVRYIVLSKMYNMPGLNLVGQQGGDYLFENINALPRAYLVDSVKKADPMTCLNAMKSGYVDPKRLAFVEKDGIKADKPGDIAKAEITKYENEKVLIHVIATGNNFLFLGDTYYPNGWKAYVDGKETEIYRANHGFRGILVPKGDHSVEFIFAPKSFETSKTLALSLSSLTILALLAGFALDLRKKKA